jgi:hypothetical protein
VETARRLLLAEAAQPLRHLRLAQSAGRGAGSRRVSRHVGKGGQRHRGYALLRSPDFEGCPDCYSSSGSCCWKSVWTRWSER